MGELPQSPEDIVFAIEDLKAGCQEGIYEEISYATAMEAKVQGFMMSSAFTVWQDGPKGRKARFVINFSRQSKHWPKGSVRMETFPNFSMDIIEGDHFLSFDIKSGYRHFRLNPKMRNWFIFRFQYTYYRCIALPFGWGRSPYWFTNLMIPLVKELRRRLRYRVLSYLDDFLIAPSPAGQQASKKDCRRAANRMQKILDTLGLTRHPTKGEWEGSTRIEHLGVVRLEVDEMFCSAKKSGKGSANGTTVDSSGTPGPTLGISPVIVVVCWSVCIPDAGDAVRSFLHPITILRHVAPFKISRRALSISPNRTHQTESSKSSRFKVLENFHEPGIRGSSPSSLPCTLYSSTDAADVGYGGTLGPEHGPGHPGLWEAQGVWGWKDRATFISLRELKAIRLVLSGALSGKVQDLGLKELLLTSDNQCLVHITNAMVSASPVMVRELRRLKRVLDNLGLHLSTEWIPSAANKFADALSRRWSRGDLQVRRQLRRSIVDGMTVPLDAFRFRPIGEHPYFARRQTLRELASPWSKTDRGLLCPPIDLNGAVVRKLRLTGAPAMLLVPDWPRQPWYQQAMDIATAVKTLPNSPQECWSAARSLNPKWRLILVEVKLPAEL